jgi:hypothetical protein
VPTVSYRPNPATGVLRTVEAIGRMHAFFIEQPGTPKNLDDYVVIRRSRAESTTAGHNDQRLETRHQDVPLLINALVSHYLQAQVHRREKETPNLAAEIITAAALRDLADELEQHATPEDFRDTHAGGETLWSEDSAVSAHQSMGPIIDFIRNRAEALTPKGA